MLDLLIRFSLSPESSAPPLASRNFACYVREKVEVTSLSARGLRLRLPTRVLIEWTEPVSLEMIADLSKHLAYGDCHSDQRKYPWYSNLPFVGQWIKVDIKEAKEDLDIIGNYPFGGHGSLKEDLKAIRKVLIDDSLPPKATVTCTSLTV